MATVSKTESQKGTAQYRRPAKNPTGRNPAARSNPKPDNNGQNNGEDGEQKPGSFDPLYIVIPGALIGIAIAIYIYGNS